MTPTRFQGLAAEIAEHVMQQMHAGPVADVTPERTKLLLATAVYAALLETRKCTIEEVVAVVGASGQPWAKACAAGIRAAFREDLEGRAR